jgi:hypothetical protein
MIRVLKFSGLALVAVLVSASFASAQNAPAPASSANGAKDQKPLAPPPPAKDPHPETTAAAGWYGSAWFTGASPSQDSSDTRAGWYGSQWITTRVTPETSASDKRAGWYGSAWTSGTWQQEGGNTDKAGWMGTSYTAFWPNSTWWNTK